MDFNFSKVMDGQTAIILTFFGDRRQHESGSLLTGIVSTVKIISDVMANPRRHCLTIVIPLLDDAQIFATLTFFAYEVASMTCVTVTYFTSIQVFLAYFDFLFAVALVPEFLRWLLL